MGVHPSRSCLPAGGLGGLILLVGACATNPPPPEAAMAAAIAEAPLPAAPAPPPPPDPWAPYIAEAAARHDVPAAWIREVMARESGGRRWAVSPAGAMGLMQVMPATWAELRSRYRLGHDPFDPRDNILAGAAYIREMYDRFGAPGFLAAYNAGPGRFRSYLDRGRPLPRETVRFVVAVAPRIAGTAPAWRAAPAVYAALPAHFPAPPPRAVALAARSDAPPGVPPVEIAAASEGDAAAPPVPAPAPMPAPGWGFRLVGAVLAAAPAGPRADAPAGPAARPAAPPAPPPGGGWTIQVGAFRGLESAQAAIAAARAAAPDLLADAAAATPTVDTPQGRLVRARLAGLSAEAAQAACRLVAQRGQACFALAPAHG